jgi:hypothetical protein
MSRRADVAPRYLRLMRRRCVLLLLRGAHSKGKKCVTAY